MALSAWLIPEITTARAKTVGCAVRRHCIRALYSYKLELSRLGRGPIIWQNLNHCFHLRDYHNLSQDVLD